jgi:hypothetical protein
LSLHRPPPLPRYHLLASLQPPPLDPRAHLDKI